MASASGCLGSHGRIDDAWIFHGAIEHLAFLGEFDEAHRVAVEGARVISGDGAGFRASGLARVAAWPLAEVGRRARLDGDGDTVAAITAEMDRLLAFSRAWPDEGVELEPRVAHVSALDIAQVEATLYVSESTAGVHVSNIISKLGVSTRTEAAEVALGSGILES